MRIGVENRLPSVDRLEQPCPAAKIDIVTEGVKCYAE
jgi:hypothetical protein